jgi:hypothetical protein
VPRLLNRVYDKVMQGASESTVKKTMFDMALKAKMKLLRKSVWVVFFDTRGKKTSI